MTYLLLRHYHHAGRNSGATECLGQIDEIDGQKSKRRPTTDSADDLAIFRSPNDDMQWQAITIAHDRIIKSVKAVTDDLSNLRFRRVIPPLYQSELTIYGKEVMDCTSLVLRSM